MDIGIPDIDCEAMTDYAGNHAHFLETKATEWELPEAADAPGWLTTRPLRAVKDSLPQEWVTRRFSRWDSAFPRGSWSGRPYGLPVHTHGAGCEIAGRL